MIATVIARNTIAIFDFMIIPYSSAFITLPSNFGDSPNVKLGCSQRQRSCGSVHGKSISTICSVSAQLFENILGQNTSCSVQSATVNNTL